MSPKPTRTHYAILQQICQLIPPHLVSRLARQYGVDKKARTFSPWSHVVALLYGQLAHASSLHDVCDALRNHSAKLFTLRRATAPSKNAFSHANRNRDPRLAKALFWRTLEALQHHYPPFAKRRSPSMPRRFKRTIRAVDSTTIQLVANCMDWAKHRRRKAAAKLHLQLDLQTFLPALAVVDTARYHDSTCARQLCANLKDGQIVVFDKAYVDYEHLFQLDQRGVFWVTRAKDNLDCRCVKRLIKKPEGRILRDDWIVLRGVKSRQKYPQRLRRVVALVEVEGREVVMFFLTNNFKWAASSITDLYQSRWAIEVFFKEIKQTLQLCDFFGHNKNAILWQVWTALLLYLLVRFLGFVHCWPHGFKRLFCLLRSCIWDGFDLGELLKSCGTASGGISLRAAPQQAWLPGFEPR